MILISFAKENNIDQIQILDEKVIQSKSRFNVLEDFIKKNKCIIAHTEDNIVGFLLFNKIYFDKDFIELLIVDEEYRRKGIALKLIKHYENIIGSGKIFTSTNKSNQIMQKLLKAAGYKRSGIIYNLDNNDPELFYFKKLL
jgi:ribosomal protein S18 acetylase RimI-like enzyme